MIARILIATVTSVLLLCVPAAAQDATGTWYSFAAQYNFTTEPVPSTATFKDAYEGSDFVSDFAAITQAVTNALQSGPPTVSGDDVMNASLAAWPD